MTETPKPQAQTATAIDLELTAPDPVPQVSADRAAGLVPVTDEVKSKLATKVDSFVADLVAQDANSPEFGQKVDQLTNMGRKEIMAAAGMSNRFLDRPVRAMDKDEGVGADLAELRRVVEELDPGQARQATGPRKILGIIPFGNKLTNYFRSYQSAQTHIQSILGNLASGKDELHHGQRRDRRGAAEIVGSDGQSGTDDPHFQTAGYEAGGNCRSIWMRPIRPRPRRSAKPHCSMSASARRTC